jgi:hypothetical protein
MIDTAWVEERITPRPSWREEFEDTKVVIRIRKSRRNRKHNGEMEKDKRTNNDLQNTTQKTKDRATGTPLRSGVKLGAPEGYQFPLHLWHLSCYSSYNPGGVFTSVESPNLGV